MKKKPYDPEYPYVGVGWFKLPADHPFNYAAYLHDTAYETWPAESTEPIDKDFLTKCQSTVITKYTMGEITIDELSKYLAQAKICYKLTRIWGTGRLAIAKAMGWKYITGNKNEYT